MHPGNEMRHGIEKIPKAVVCLAGTAWNAVADISDQILIDCAIHLDARSPSHCMHAFVRSGHASRACAPRTCSWSLREHEQGRRQDEQRGAHLDCKEVSLGGHGRHSLSARPPSPNLADGRTWSRALFELLTLDSSRPPSWEALESSSSLRRD